MDKEKMSHDENNRDLIDINYKFHVDQKFIV